ncbi:MAG TPA: (2Fe-2S)-binding protein [Aldersonia sp.]
MSEHAGTALIRPEWLADRVDDLGRAWEVTDRRVAGTLWWYMAADTMLADVVAALDLDTTPDPALESITLTLRSDGGVAAVHHHANTKPDEAIDHLARAVAAIVDTLAEVSGAGRASLAAITTDTIASRARTESAATDLAARLAIPAPRYVDVAGRRFVRRASCCLIYRSPRAGMCVSCPKRDPDERAVLLARMAAG